MGIKEVFVTKKFAELIVCEYEYFCPHCGQSSKLRQILPVTYCSKCGRKVYLHPPKNKYPP